MTSDRYPRRVLAPRRSPLRPLLAVVCSVALLAGISGCGDSGDDGKAKPPITTSTAIAQQESLLGDSAETAGEATSYEPTGDIVADVGFRPDVDGFSFENYGNDVGPENMTPYEVADIFGDGVCVRGSGVDCELTPLAAKWMKTQNDAMDGGHCMGFSVAALRMFSGAVDPADYGAKQTIGLPIQGNTDLQSLIAESWTYQNLPTIQEGEVTGTPTEIVDRLEQDLNSGDETYTVAIFRADGGGGHAITPFAVEDQGDGQKKILVYDNNFPGIVRAIDVDTNADTWHYVGGTNPKELGEVYEGDAETQSLSLYPTSPGEDYQPCPFCADGDAGGAASEDSPDTDEDLGAAKAAAKPYNEVRLNAADGANHPHIILVDGEGRQTGIVDGKLVRDIPGVEISRNLAVQNWNETAEPAYRAPVGLPLAVVVDGTELTKRTKANITLTGPGLAVEIDDIKLAPGQVDHLEFPGDGAGLVYETDGTSKSAPNLYATVEDDGEYFVIGTGALGFGAGSRIGFELDEDAKTFVLDTTGTKPSAASDGLDGKSLYVATLVRENEEGESAWLTDPIALRGGKVGERMLVDYGEAPAKGEPLTITAGKPDGPYQQYEAPADKD